MDTTAAPTDWWRSGCGTWKDRSRTCLSINCRWLTKATTKTPFYTNSHKKTRSKILNILYLWAAIKTHTFPMKVQGSSPSTQLTNQLKFIISWSKIYYEILMHNKSSGSIFTFLFPNCKYYIILYFIIIYYFQAI